jgi:outer membrane receptor protein involved in Fe transport
MPSRIRNIRLSPIALAVITAVTAPLAFSQSSEQEVVVSGSRIKRDNYSTSAPVQIIRNEDSVLAGFSSTTEVLQGTAITGGQGQINNAYGGYVTDGGPGANTLGLRGFAPTRSLILLNGRRMAPSGTRGAVGAADLNTLPSSIIDRIEVLKDGASSIYGSDAVAGVVNIITKTNLTGVTTTLNQTSTEQGGGNTTNFSLAGGFVGDKARFSGSYNMTQRTDLTLGDRDWTQCNTDYRRKLIGTTMGDWGSWDYVDPATGKPAAFDTVEIALVVRAMSAPRAVAALPASMDETLLPLTVDRSDDIDVTRVREERVAAEELKAAGVKSKAMTSCTSDTDALALRYNGCTASPPAQNAPSGQGLHAMLAPLTDLHPPVAA